MRWYLNDVSLQGQYNNKHYEFLKTLDELFSIGNRNGVFLENLHVISTFGTARVDKTMTVTQVMYDRKFPEFQSAKLSLVQLINQSRPFEKKGEEKIYENSGNKINFEGVDVTLSAMGLAVYNLISNCDSSLFSFSEGVQKFERNPLPVEYCDNSGLHKMYNLENFWNTNDFEKHISDFKPRNSWENLIEILREEFKNIEFRNEIFEIRKDYQYSEKMHKSIYELMGIINNYMCHRINGKEDKIAQDIRKKYFPGKKGTKFSNESPENIEEFKEQMTFNSMHGGKILATWHGKFRTSEKMRFSIHFDWPPSSDSKKIEILYIGKKITIKK